MHIIPKKKNTLKKGTILKRLKFFEEHNDCYKWRNIATGR